MSQVKKYGLFTYVIDVMPEIAQAKTYSPHLGMAVNYMGRDAEEAERNLINAIDKGEL